MSGISYGDGATKRSIASLLYQDGATKRTIQNAWIGDGGVNRQVYSAYTAVGASVSPTSISKFGFGTNTSGPSGSTDAVTATGSGGSGGYTYSWTRISGDTGTNISATNTAAVTFSRASCSDGVNYVSTWRCTISDGTTSASADVTVTLGYIKTG